MKHQSTIIYLIPILLFFVLAGLFYAWTNPLWSYPDELGHFAYLEYLYNNHSLPNYTSHLNFWEAHQPPLYYLIALPFVFISKLFDNLETAVFVLRTYSIILGVLTIILSYQLSIKYFSRRSIFILVPAFIALNPMFLYISSGINNDNLANFFGTLILLAIMRVVFAMKLSHADLILGGLVMGGALLTKLVLYPLVLILFIILLIKIISNKQSAVKNIILLIVIPALISAWWFIRNLLIYGDLFGLKNTAALWEGQKKNLFEWENFKNWISTTYKSFFGILGKLNIALPNYTYLFFTLLIVVAVIGFILLLKKKPPKNIKNLLAIYIICVLSIFLGVFLNSLNFYQPQGRYLFPIIAAVYLCLTVGLSYFLIKKFRLLIMSFIVIILLLINLKSISTVWSYYNKIEPPRKISSNLIEYNSNEWKAVTDINNFKVMDGKITGEATEQDAQIFSPNDLKIYSPKLLCIEITMTVATGEKGQIFYTGLSDTGFQEKNSKEFKIIADGKPNSYKVCLYPKTLINQLRIDPTNKPGEFKINRLEIIHE